MRLFASELKLLTNNFQGQQKMIQLLKFFNLSPLLLSSLLWICFFIMIVLFLLNLTKINYKDVEI